jgi:hypothetical protein
MLEETPQPYSYFLNCDISDSTRGYAAYALDTENADRLWDVSQQLVRGIGE